MQRFRFLAALLLLAAPSLGAQRATALEAGVFLQYSKYDAFTNLASGVGAGARIGAYFWRNIALEYEGDFTKTRSSRVGDLTALNNRIDAIFYFPIGENLRFLAGGGWTGTQYASDTTKNQFDSGGNAVVGFKYCMNEDWSWRADVNADFKDPSDQAPNGERTRTYNVRFGFNRFLGKAKNSPCYQAPPPPPPPPAPAPRPAPQPPPAPAPQPAPAPAPVPAPPPPPAPAPQPAPPPPAPARREIVTLRGAHFAFNKSILTAAAKDTLNRAVGYLKEHTDIKVEIEGHTDSVGSAQYNQLLSERRANSVKTYLVSQGIAQSRVSTRGFGKSQPIASNSTEQGRAENRRVVIIEVP